MRFAKNTQHDTSKVLRLPRKMTMDTSKVLISAAPATKTAAHLVKTTQKYCARHTKQFSTRYKTHLNVSRSATPATRNEATRRLKPPEMTPSAELTIGTAIRGSRERCERLRACQRLRTVGHRRANTPSTPRPPE